VLVCAVVFVACLLGAESAHAIPSVTFKCNPAPEDCSGWYRTNVSIDWTVIPSDAVVVGCVDKTFTTDTPGTNEFCSADDGSATVTVQLKIKVDKTPPVVTGGQPSRAADVDGWYNHAVGITFSGTDQTSGIEACTSTTYGGPDSAAASLAGTCVDKAGNQSDPFPYGLKYDETAPLVTAGSPERSPDANGWYNHPVGFNIQGSDATSGIADCPSVTYGGPDTAAGSVTGQCRDRAGNVSSRAFALKYDQTAPQVSGANPERAPNEAGWFNQPVSFEFFGTDQTSGVDLCSTKIYSGPDSATGSLSGTCTDKAGNQSAALSVAVKYDEAPPVATGATPERAPNEAGWYNSPVSVAFSGADQTSGVDACTTESYSGPDSASASVAGRCTDKAGNVSGSLAFGLKYDATEPSVTGVAPERPPDHGTWFTRPVRFDFTGEDATSGLAACPPVTYSGPDARDASVTGRCFDRAGNVSSRAFPLMFDATPPQVTDLKATSGDHRVALSWQTAADTESIDVVRTPGLDGGAASLVFHGLDTGFVDSRVDNGTSYTYEVRAKDPADNASSEMVTVTPNATRPSLLAPARGAVIKVGQPPLLQWTPVPRARYYNVQLMRAAAIRASRKRGGTHKILSAWPSRPRYQLRTHWTYRGKRRRLSPGRYVWFVWPGYGPRSKADYGRLIGRSTFIVGR
jgi:hypothetical protein